MSQEIILFVIICVGLLSVDFIVHRKPKVMPLSSAIAWSAIYISAAMVFAWYLYNQVSPESASLFLTGYALEKALAFDNLFVFSIIFTYFGIGHDKQHAALHWGIAGAIVFRFIFVALGVSLEGLIGPLVELVFAGMIIFSIYMIVSAKDEDVDYEKIWYVVKLKQWFPSITTFAIAVCVIEISDVLFSFDSVPAILAVTKDPFLVYSAMIFAILGLRSMYFVISALSRALKYIDDAVIVILSFIAGKLILSAIFGLHIDANTSLLIVLSILTVGVVASLIRGKNHV